MLFFTKFQMDFFFCPELYQKATSIFACKDNFDFYREML